MWGCLWLFQCNQFLSKLPCKLEFVVGSKNAKKWSSTRDCKSNRGRNSKRLKKYSLSLTRAKLREELQQKLMSWKSNENHGITEASLIITHQKLKFRMLSVATRVCLNQNTSFKQNVVNIVEFIILQCIQFYLILMQVESNWFEFFDYTYCIFENILQVRRSWELGNLCGKCVPMQRHSDECGNGRCGWGRRWNAPNCKAEWRRKCVQHQKQALPFPTQRHRKFVQKPQRTWNL